MLILSIMNKGIYTVWIYVKTGLHIGAGNDRVEIGWLDQPFIKLKNWEPYIPGSSLKWKMRSLLEISEGKVDDEWNVHSCTDENCNICNFFGRRGEYMKDNKNLKPGIFIFRDMYLAKNYDKEDVEEKFEEKILYDRDKYLEYENMWEKFMEEKMEVWINRKTWTAMSSGPRPIERVPAWTLFKGELVLRNFWNWNNILKYWDKWNLLNVLKGLLERDYLWWQWTRWHWQVKIYFE